MSAETSVDSTCAANDSDSDIAGDSGNGDVDYTAMMEMDRLDKLRKHCGIGEGLSLSSFSSPLFAFGK